MGRSRRHAVAVVLPCHVVFHGSSKAASDALNAANRRFATLVERLPAAGADPAQIVVERSMYGSVNGVFWAAGTSALGTQIRQADRPTEPASRA